MNKKFIATLSILLVLIGVLQAQVKIDSSKLTELWNPVPKIVTPGSTPSSIPSDATMLFDGKNNSAWTSKDGGIAKWKVSDGAMTVAAGAGEIKTKASFGDCQLHIEWRSPAVVKGSGQGRGNSGIFLMGRYELQVLDCYNNVTYSNGQAGSIYKQLIPLANASRKPGEWQTYDIVFMSPRFNEDGSIKIPANITVLHNGVLIQNHSTLAGSTQYIGVASYQKHPEKEPIVLQDHGDAVSYRNIWIREL